MKCFVTGASGFIGGSLVKRLVNEGYSVRGLIHEKEPSKFEKKVEYVYGDIQDKKTIEDFLKDIDVVIHCAAYVKDYGSRKFFYDINYQGTKNLVEVCKNFTIKRFIFLGHINYETDKKIGYYRESKIMAEDFLRKEYKKNGFPVVIVRTGNTYGPRATTWVLRPLESINKKQIALIDNGKGIFLHTYIDNLLDAILASIVKNGVIGEDFNITDGDYNISWGKYLNDLARIAGKSQIKSNLSKRNAIFISQIMMFLYKILRVKPWITPYAVEILTNRNTVSIEKAMNVLDYKPKVDYDIAMKNIEKWLINENYI